jgi:SAM-dependent methyltransferase
VGERDVVYDLGCGDGRIVIAAARKCGARGVGIDVDPERIKSCQRNAAEAGVGDRVRFLRESFFTADLSEATVVMLYLLPAVNSQLRPRLRRELRPGSRIISHAFSMSDWPPDRVVNVAEQGRILYRWTVPANVGGRWRCSLRMADGRKREAVLEFEQEFQTVVGTAFVGGSEIALENTRLIGPEFSFDLREATYRCRVDGETMRGAGRAVGSRGRAIDLDLRARRERTAR